MVKCLRVQLAYVPTNRNIVVRDLEMVEFIVTILDVLNIMVQNVHYNAIRRMCMTTLANCIIVLNVLQRAKTVLSIILHSSSWTNMYGACMAKVSFRIVVKNLSGPPIDISTNRNAESVSILLHNIFCM